MCCRADEHSFIPQRGDRAFLLKRLYGSARPFRGRRRRFDSQASTRPRSAALPACVPSSHFSNPPSQHGVSAFAKKRTSFHRCPEAPIASMRSRPTGAPGPAKVRIRVAHFVCGGIAADDAGPVAMRLGASDACPIQCSGRSAFLGVHNPACGPRITTSAMLSETTTQFRHTLSLLMLCHRRNLPSSAIPDCVATTAFESPARLRNAQVLVRNPFHLEKSRHVAASALPVSSPSRPPHGAYAIGPYNPFIILCYITTRNVASLAPYSSSSRC
ncbi:hypothetical protein PLICRDRAFT_646432 [Plicaturopsis crispa FD-325 SS-3]|nr:hypothetical protein PLICRDRAFT_646432 [Plicaturopsis crispa FD-325 SS-3]